MHISSRDNPKIKQYVKLAASKKHRREAGMFVLEGARLCKDAFDLWQQDKLNITACFATLKALEKYSEYVDEKWFSRCDNFYTIDDDIALKMSDSDTIFSSNSTSMLLDNRFTFTQLIPFISLTALSTWAWHALQVIPITLYFSFLIGHLSA